MTYAEGRADGVRQGEFKSIRVLSRILQSMKVDPNNSAGLMRNQILNEVYENVYSDLISQN